MAHRLQPESDRIASHPWRSRVAAGVATLTLAASMLGAAPATLAQDDGTGGAPPRAETNCVLVPATDIERVLAGSDIAAATPVPSASPAATPVTAATPVSSPAAERLPFDRELLLKDLTATATSLTSCLSEEQFTNVAQRTSPLFRGQLVGTPRELPADLYASVAASFPKTEAKVVEIGNPALVDESTAEADVIWQVGHQVRVDRWRFRLQTVEGLRMWVVDRAEPGTMSPASDPQMVSVEIAKNRYTLETDTVTGDTVQINATNADAVDHELLVLKLGGDAKTSDLLTTPGPALPKGIDFIGQATIPASAEGRLLLADLEPGRYAIVCLLQNEDGLPHLAEGMETSFTVKK